MTMAEPRISVVLPVYNGMPYLPQAVGGILDQGVNGFELLVINDGSSDGSAQWLDALQDPRVRVVHQPNAGLAATLNRAIAQARGEYIVRQDQDDVSLAGRLQAQVDFLDANPEVAMVGAAAEVWEGAVRTERRMAPAPDNASLQMELLFSNPFVHSSVALRRAAVQTVGGYTEDRARQPPEDYELWSRLARRYRLANLPETLLAYREVPGSMTRSGPNPFAHKMTTISGENLAAAAGVAETAPAVRALAALMQGCYADAPPGVSLGAMQSVLRAALRGTAARCGASPGQLDAAERWRMRQLRFRHADWQLGGMPSRLLQGTAGRALKAAALRLLKRTA